MATKPSKSPSAQTELALLHVRSTLTPAEAAQFLSLHLNVNVTLDAVWAHVREKRLAIAIQFDDTGLGRRGRIVPRIEHNFVEAPCSPPEIEDLCGPQDRENAEFPFGRGLEIGNPVVLPREPLKAAVRDFEVESVVQIEPGFPQQLQGTWDLCCVGEWELIVRRLREGPPCSRARTLYLLTNRGTASSSIFVAQPGEPDFAWEITNRHGTSSHDILEQSQLVFRLSVLEKFIASFGKPKQEDGHSGELNMNTLLCILGALVHADGGRKNLLHELLDIETRGFSVRNLDKYFAAASAAFEEVRPSA